ncbi:winged helix-turn-helix domain-containing protein [Methanocaldococcus villosus]|uniref:winged helix-turn-helix domain-containing protein n=1 Tax=Methanocaldococcus villosus TaxID=667126 RepID=UPI0003716985|nr:winged helix-turn-helix domain-containing protein [Methanocaldococcus villosus]
MENMWAKIGETAGAIYNLLKEKGDMSLSKLENSLRKKGYNSNIIKMAVGWLAREDNVEVLKDDRKWIIKLKK